MRRALGIVHTKILSDTQPPFKKHDIEFKFDLADEELDQYWRATIPLHNFEADGELFRLVLWNYQEYYDVLRGYLRAYIERDSEVFERKPISLAINAAALNLLMSARMYLDYSETTLKRRYGEESARVQNFKQYTSTEYDDNFSYRFLYKLRNYSQHCGLPIHTIEYGGIPSQKRGLEFYLEVSVDRDKLLKEFDWKLLKSEIKNLPPKIEMNFHIDSMMQSLHRIHTRLTRDEFDDLQEHAAYLQELLERAGYKSGEPCIFELGISEDDLGHITDLKQLTVLDRVPVELIRAILNKDIDQIMGPITIYRL